MTGKTQLVDRLQKLINLNVFRNERKPCGV